MIKNILLLGTAYTGKTWAAGYCVAKTPRPLTVIVHDKLDQSYQAHLPEETLYVSVLSDEHIVPEDFLYLRKDKYSCIYFTVYDLHPEQVDRFFHSLTLAIKMVGNLLFVIDEAHLFLRRTVSHNIVGFLRGARRWGVDLLFVSHRYQDISIDIRCVINMIGIFRVTEARDLVLLQQELPIEHIIEQIPTLTLGQHFFVCRSTGVVTGPTIL